MEGLTLIGKRTVDSIPTVHQNESPYLLEDFKAVVKNLTENALSILNKIGVNEMRKKNPNAEIIEDYTLLFHYLDFLKRFVSSHC